MYIHVTGCVMTGRDQAIRLKAADGPDQAWGIQSMSDTRPKVGQGCKIEVASGPMAPVFLASLPLVSYCGEQYIFLFWLYSKWNLQNLLNKKKI